MSQSQSLAKPVEALEPYDPITMHRDERIYLERQIMEYSLRLAIERTQDWTSQFRRSLLTPKVVSEVHVSDLLDTCNKTAPIYFLHDVPGPQLAAPLALVVENHVYLRWMKPCRTPVDCQRFLCKFINLKDAPGISPPRRETIDALVRLNRTICDATEAQRRTWQDAFSQGAACVSDANQTITPQTLPFHVLQPLFRAVLIVVCRGDYNLESWETVGALPMFLVRTGVDAGLSAPVSFAPIADRVHGVVYSELDTGRAVRCSLETAVDFVMGLETREIAAFGMRPDPVAAAKMDPWTLPGGEKVCTPSSTWVDLEKHPERAEYYHYLNTGIPIIREEILLNDAREKRDESLALNEGSAQRHRRKSLPQTRLRQV